MIGRINKPWEKSYDPALRVVTGEALTPLHPDDGDFPGWIWAKNTAGLGGWLPDDAVEGAHGGPGRAREDFDTAELSVTEGDLVEMGEERLGWVRCRAADGREGWVPSACIAPLDRSDGITTQSGP